MLWNKEKTNTATFPVLMEKHRRLPEMYLMGTLRAMIGQLSSKCVWLSEPWCGTNTSDKPNSCSVCQLCSSSLPVAARRKRVPGSDWVLGLAVPLLPNMLKICHLWSVKATLDQGDEQFMSCYSKWNLSDLQIDATLNSFHLFDYCIMTPVDWNYWWLVLQPFEKKICK